MCGEKSGPEERKTPTSATGDKLVASQKAHLQHTDFSPDEGTRGQEGETLQHQLWRGLCKAGHKVLQGSQ